MKNTVLILGFALLPAFAAAQELPRWVAPSSPEDMPVELENTLRDADEEARTAAYQLVSPSTPAVVREGPQADGVCMGCHATTGIGGPQSAPLAGLPTAYFVRQIDNFRTGARGTAYRQNMAEFAKQMTMEQINEAAAYYASLPVETMTEVVEVDIVPRTVVGPRDISALHPDGGQEPLGERIVEIPKTPEAPYRSGAPAFTAYVPMGSIAQGRELAMRRPAAACSFCHGADLNGIGDVPGIAGRSAIHNARQMMEFRNGSRAGQSSELMLAVVEGLTDAEIIAISAYVASLPAH